MISKVLLYQAPEQTAGDAAEDDVVAFVGAAGAIFIQYTHIAAPENDHGRIGGGAFLQSQDIPPRGAVIGAHRQGQPASGLLFLDI